MNGVARANLSGGPGPGEEPDAIAYFRPLPKLGKLSSMKKDPLPVRFDPAVAASIIPVHSATGEVRNHLGYSIERPGGEASENSKSEAACSFKC